MAKEKLKRTRRIGRESWIKAAREALIQGGVEAIKIERLANHLNATRSAFYYHFKSRAALLDELLEDWRTTNTEPFYKAFNSVSGSGLKELKTLFRMWVEEDEYSHHYDSAVRDWARNSKKVATAVKKIDRIRIDLLTRVFGKFGFAAEEAAMRARVLYFSQVGYYTLGLAENKQERYKLAPLYLKGYTQ